MKFFVKVLDKGYLLKRKMCVDFRQSKVLNRNGYEYESESRQTDMKDRYISLGYKGYIQKQQSFKTIFLLLYGLNRK